MTRWKNSPVSEMEAEVKRELMRDRILQLIGEGATDEEIVVQTRASRARIVELRDESESAAPAKKPLTGRALEAAQAHVKEELRKDTKKQVTARRREHNKAGEEARPRDKERAK